MKEAEIRALSRMLDRMDYYRLFKLERAAPAPQIRAAYHRMRRGFHPDAFLGRDSDLLSAVSQISKRVNEGYQVLRDPQLRAAYDRALDEGQLRFTREIEDAARTESAARHGGTTVKGKRFWTDSQSAERVGDLVAAIKAIKMALTFERENEHFKQKLAELEARVPKPKKPANPYAIR
jgi:DnaJ-class molecular chaperone